MSKILVTPHHCLLQKGLRPLLAVRKVSGCTDDKTYKDKLKLDLCGGYRG